MNRSETAVLRTKLRALNIEYSALVRCRGEDTRVRMEEMRAQRRALMALIAEQRLGDRQQPASVAIEEPPVLFTLGCFNQADRDGTPQPSNSTRVRIRRALTSAFLPHIRHQDSPVR